MGTALVYTFPADKNLKEVVFLPYLRRWRVYEVRFRDAVDRTRPVERG